MENEPETSIILPCRDEEEGLGFCLDQIRQTIQKNSLDAEVIVSDSSKDKSPEITVRHGAILVKHDKYGYGNAYMEGFKRARGKYIFMADADATYDFKKIPEFIQELKNGNDLVIGNRFGGTMEKGAMPFLNRYLGNPVLSFVLRILFNAKIKDSQSGMRAIKKEALHSLALQTAGMEFASEMIIKSLKRNLKIKEIPINYSKRKGKSKLRPYSDAWKHLRFMLLYSPIFLFFIPGLVFLFVGFCSMLWLYWGNPWFFGIRLFYHPLFISSLLIISGYQLVIFSIFAKTYAIVHLKENSPFMEKLYKFATVERASVAGILIALAGAGIYGFILFEWLGSHFGELNEIKNSIVALTLITVGIQTIFSSFMLSVLGIKEK